MLHAIVNLNVLVVSVILLVISGSQMNNAESHALETTNNNVLDSLAIDF